MLATPDVTVEAAEVWGAAPVGKAKSPAAPEPAGAGSAPPAVWARYIDSRLKQFCTR